MMIIAGEASGDLHGSALIKELLAIDDTIEIFGIGGDKMIAEGMKTIYHTNDMGFLGFVEVIKHLPFIRKVKKDLIKVTKKEYIKNVVLIDYPGFNLSMAKSFHKLGLKNIYYISPQIWAWGKGRIEKIKKIIDRMIVFFPFEKELYSNNNVSVDFVGHPLVKKIEQYNFLSKEELIQKYSLDTEKELLVLLPGSRKQEIEKIFLPSIEAADRLAKELNLQTVVACAENIDKKVYAEFQSNYNFKIIKGETYNLLKNAKFAIVKSGTSTLEAGIIGTPFIVVYATNYFTYLISKSLIKIKNIALANIVAGKTIVNELIQDDVNHEEIYLKSKSIITDEEKYNLIRSELKEIKNKLNTEGNPSKKAAEIIYAELVKV